MKKVIFSPLFLVFWLIITTAISFSLLKSLIDILGANERLSELQTKNSVIEKNIAKLEISIKNAETPFAKEKIIREELGLQLPGETIVQVNLGENGASPTPSPSVAPIEAQTPQNTPPSNSQKPPIYRQWLALFFGQ